VVLTTGTESPGFKTACMRVEIFKNISVRPAVNGYLTRFRAEGRVSNGRKRSGAPSIIASKSWLSKPLQYCSFFLHTTCMIQYKNMDSNILLLQQMQTS